MNDTAVLARPDIQGTAAVRGLEVRSIAKSYDRKAVLHDVSLGVSRGEVVGLLGPNGAGKTTSFYMIVGLVALDAGKRFIEQDEARR